MIVAGVEDETDILYARGGSCIANRRKEKIWLTLLPEHAVDVSGVLGSSLSDKGQARL